LLLIFARATSDFPQSRQDLIDGRLHGAFHGEAAGAFVAAAAEFRRYVRHLHRAFASHAHADSVFMGLPEEQRDFHTGLDISTPVGTKVQAPADGVVVSCGQKGGYGNSIIVNTDYLAGHRELVGKFVRVTQKAYRTLVMVAKFFL